VAVDSDYADIDSLPMLNRRSLISTVVTLVIAGVIVMANLVSQNRLAAIRSVDVVQLIGTGMCFGVALFALIIFFRTPRA
jgi:uncharacterized membrane protein YccC